MYALLLLNEDFSHAYGIFHLRTLLPVRLKDNIEVKLVGYVKSSAD